MCDNEALSCIAPNKNGMHAFLQGRDDLWALVDIQLEVLDGSIEFYVMHWCCKYFQLLRTDKTGTCPQHQCRKHFDFCESLPEMREIRSPRRDVTASKEHVSQCSPMAMIMDMLKYAFSEVFEDLDDDIEMRMKQSNWVSFPTRIKCVLARLEWNYLS